MSTEAITTVAASGLDAKRELAKEYLGQRWVNHPAYLFDPRHSTNPDIYVHARQRYLLSVSHTAAKDRAHNPVFHRAEHIRHALSHHN